LSQAEQHFLDKHKIPEVQQPLYLPDLTPCNFFFICQDTTYLKARKIEDAEIKKQNTMQQLTSI
jgi:hypothetical protein